jgi:hypothetical protein
MRCALDSLHPGKRVGVGGDADVIHLERLINNFERIGRIYREADEEGDVGHTKPPGLALAIHVRSRITLHI